MMPAGPLDPATHSAADVVATLGLEPLDQEGGFFRRTAEAGERGDFGAKGKRRAYSVIYALLTPESFSAMHRLITDEVWCWHAGDALESLRLYPNGTGEWVTLGPAVSAGQRLQDVVAAGVWQGTRLAPGGRWGLVSCIVAPEFHWGDFELAERSSLLARYGAFAEGVLSLTRQSPAIGQL